MKLMLRPEWRLWPLSSFLGLLDLKTGVTIALLFAVRPPKITHRTRTHDQSSCSTRSQACTASLQSSPAQAAPLRSSASIYILPWHSSRSPGACAWCMTHVSPLSSNATCLPLLQEEPKKTLYFAHLFFADHIFSTSWTIFFAIVWWLWTPHDGRQQANSSAQKEMMDLGNSSAPHLTPEQRKDAAMAIWNHEKGLAAAVIVVSWLFKVRHPAPPCCRPS